MSDSKHKKSAEADAAGVDWAERLRASMNESSVEDTSPTQSFADEEDDLAALLRAQLAHRSDHVESTPDLPDTSDFEEAYFDAEEDLDEEDFDAEEGLDEEDFDAEDVLDGEDFDAEEEEPDGEEATEETTDFEDDTLSDQQASDVLDELELLEFSDEESEESEMCELIVEDVPETTDCLFAPVLDCEVPGVSRRSIDSEEKPCKAAVPTDCRLTDACLNGRGEACSNDRRDGDRRQSLREENDRLLEEEARRAAAAAEDIYTEDSSESLDLNTADNDIGRSVSDTSAARRRSRPAVIGFHPLQIGYEAPTNPTAGRRTVAAILDEEMPIGSSGAAKEKAKDYTASMPGTAPDDVHLRDTALWMDLGYSAEVHHAEDRRAAERARTEKSSFADSVEEDPTVTPAPDDEEYGGRVHTDRALARHRTDRLERFIRLGIAAAGLFLAVLWDILPSIFSASGMQNTTLQGPFYPIIGLLLTWVICLPFLTRIGRGIAGLCHFSPTRYSVTALSLAVHTLYTGLCIGVSAVSTDFLPLFGGLPLFALTVAAFSEMVEAAADWDAFGVVSAGRAVSVLTDEDTPASASDPAQSAVGGRSMASLTVLRTALTDRVFARMSAYNPYMGRLNYLLPAALGVAIVSAGLSLARGGALLSDGARIFTVVFLAALPAAYLIALSLPLFRVNRHLRPRGSAVIGSAAAEEYSIDSAAEPRKIYFSDKDIITAARRKEITLRAEDTGGLPAAHWRRMANRLFYLLQSPLSEERPLEDDGSPEALDHLHVEIAETADHYMKVYLMDNTPGARSTVEVMMGSHEALSRRGIRLPRRTMETVYCKTEDSHVLYLAFDGFFRIAYATEYRPSRAFRALAEGCARCHARPVLASYDPMITPALLSEPRFAPLAGLDMVRPDCVEVPRRRCASGVVTLGGGRELLPPLLATQQMRRCYRLGHGFAWLFFALTAVLSFVAVLTGHDACIGTVTAILLQSVPAALALPTVILVISREKLLLAPPKEKNDAKASSETKKPSSSAKQTPPEKSLREKKEATRGMSSAKGKKPSENHPDTKRK